ncbi:MAG: NAD-dependent epimerase/dehydratase family protein [Chthoniobacterales bacterium]
MQIQDRTRPELRDEAFAGQEVLVTGASGFIGWHVANQLVHAGAKVRALIRPTTAHDEERFEWFKGDLLQRDTIDAAVRGCRYVFHVAGDYRFWARDPREIYANNVQGAINLLEAANAAGVEKIVCTSTTGILEPGTPERPTDESRLASPEHFRGPYKRSKFAAFLEVQKRADRGWPIVTVLPTAPIGPHDMKPTPTGMIIVQFLNRRIPMLARTGLNFVDVRQCARGHLLAMTGGPAGERYLLGGIDLWLREFLQRLEPYARHRAPRLHAPHWLSYATACASETMARFSSRWKPFVTRESVAMSRGPHFSSNAKAEKELGYEVVPIDAAIRDAIADFAARGLVPAVTAARLTEMRSVETAAK